jgi:hypothetical protein
MPVDRDDNLPDTFTLRTSPTGTHLAYQGWFMQVSDACFAIEGDRAD